MRNFILMGLLLWLISGCASSDGQADKETHVIPQQTTGSITLTLPAGTTAESLSALKVPLVQIKQSMTVSDSALKGGSQTAPGGTSEQTTKPETSLDLDMPTNIPDIPSVPGLPDNPDNPDKPTLPIDPDPEADPEWTVLETYNNLSSPPEIDPGRSFSWLKKGKGSNYPTRVRLSWPECNKSCIIENTADDYNWSSPRDGSKCVWYSAKDNEFPNGSFFSDNTCTTTKGLIEVESK